MYKVIKYFKNVKRQKNNQKNTWGLPINIKIHNFKSILTGITLVTQVHPLRKLFPLKKHTHTHFTA